MDDVSARSMTNQARFRNMCRLRQEILQVRRIRADTNSSTRSVLGPVCFSREWRMSTMSEPDAQLAPRVLIAVSDALLRRVASTGLRERGFSVSATNEESAALVLARSFAPDVVLVDLSLRSPVGGSLFDAIRASADCYLVGLAATDSEAERIRALRGGADDAVSLPISADELAARCQALLRRPRQLHSRWDPMAASMVNIGPLQVDLGRKELRVRNHDVAVTRIEFALFEQLCRKPAEVCSRVHLLEQVWGPNWVGDTHVVDVHLSNLRRKLQRHAPELRFIHTVRGIGFRLSNDLLRAERDRRGDDAMVATA
jgi:DNA-binding response OmpR family regulator